MVLCALGISFLDKVLQDVMSIVDKASNVDMLWNRSDPPLALLRQLFGSGVQGLRIHNT